MQARRVWGVRVVGVVLVALGLLALVGPALAQQGTVGGATPVTVPAGKDATVTVKAFCIEYGKDFPTTFPPVGGLADPAIRGMLRYAISKGYTESNPYQVQLAIWRQTTGEWKAQDRTLAEEIFSNATTVAETAATGTSLVDAAKGGQVQVAATTWTPVTGLPDSTRPWLANGTVTVSNKGTTDLNVAVPVGIVLDSPNQQDMVMYVVAAQAQATTAPTAAATAAATTTPAATTAPTAVATAAATAAPTTAATIAPTAAATAAPAATAVATPAGQKLPSTGGSPTENAMLMILVGAALVAAGLGTAFYSRPRA